MASARQSTQRKHLRESLAPLLGNTAGSNEGKANTTWHDKDYAWVVNQYEPFQEDLSHASSVGTAAKYLWLCTLTDGDIACSQIVQCDFFP